MWVHHFANFQVPRGYTEDDLLPIFAEFGPVEEVMIIRDRVTQAHKGK